jgi:hypothetical protein
VSSCHSLVDDELPDIVKLPVINSVLVADEIFKIHVSLTASMGDSIPQEVANAQVVILSSNGNPDTLKYTKKGWYISNRLVKSNTTYNCLVDIPGYQQASAQTYVPLQTGIYNVAYTDLVSKGMDNEKISSFEFSIMNDTTKRLFWEVKFKSLSFTFIDDAITGKRIAIDEDLYHDFSMKPEQDNVMLSEAMPLDVFSNEKMKKPEYLVRFYISENNVHYSDKGKFSIELRSVDETYYNYQKQLFIYIMAGYTGLGSNAQTYPLYSNVKNGYGLFTSYSVISFALDNFKDENK